MANISSALSGLPISRGTGAIQVWIDFDCQSQNNFRLYPEVVEVGSLSCVGSTASRLANCCDGSRAA